MRQGFEKSEIEEVDVRDTSLTSGLIVDIKLTSLAIEFDGPVTKKLKDRINMAGFTGKPNDNCHLGNHTVKLSIIDNATEIEYQSHMFEVRVVDFAFDHISRPLLSRAISVIIGVGSLAMFILTFFNQIDTTFGFASGTVVGLLATGNFLRFRSLYQQPKITNAP